MSRKRHLVIVIIILLFTGRLSAQLQETSTTAINYIPPSPTAAALGKYGEIPVNHYTGIPEISIPIFTVSKKSITLPISLSYHAGGHRVADNASWVGLGWSLQGGGVITRSVRGLPDELDNGYHLGYNLIKTDINKYHRGELTQTQRITFLEKLADGVYDGEPDEYFFNFSGKSGRIIFDENGKAIISPVQKLNVEVPNNDINGGFIITDEYGVKYTFASMEFSNNTDACELVPIGQFISSWYLSSIIAPNGEKISFSYQAGTTYLNIIPSETRYHLIPNSSSGCRIPNPTECARQYRISTNRLSEISWDGNTIKFIGKTKRTDLLAPSDEYRLDTILINNGTLQRRFAFSYGVFGGSKLKLNAVQEYSVNDNNLKKPYTFQYFNESAVPPVTSRAQDHWGYHNANGATTLVPAGTVRIGTSNVVLNGADRKPDDTRAKAGILTKITYPTGGSSDFTYSLNDYSYINGQPASERFKERREHYVYVDPGNTYNSQTFVLDKGVIATVSYSVNVTEDGSVHPNYNEYVTLTRNGSSQSVFSSIGGVGHVEVSLDPGTYTMVANTANPITRSSMHVSYELETDILIPLKSVVTGGLKITKIVDKEGGSGSKDIVTDYKYTMEGDSTRSSGATVSNPLYEYRMTQLSGLNFSPCDYHVRTAVGITLGSTKGGHVGYRDVSVIKSDGGMTRYKFTSFFEYLDVTFPGYPFPSSSSRDYLRGQPLSVTHYRASGGRFVKATQMQNTYIIRAENQKESRGIKVGYILKHPTNTGSDFSVSEITNTTHWFHLDSVYNYDFGSDGNAELLTITKNFHDSPVHLQPTRIVVTKSDASKEVTLTTYPNDYASGTAFIDNMKTNHLIAYPIERVRYKEVGSTRTFLSGQITRYLAGGKGLVDQVLSLDATQPIALSSFKFSNRAAGQLPPTGTATAFVPHGAYRTVLTYSNYDSFGNPQQLQPADGTPTVYLWGYQGQYPVAEIKNATLSEVLATGVSTSVLNNTGSTDTQRLTELNKVRNHATMKKALVGTYFYRPLVGMIRATDASGRTTYYNYDGFGRLQDVKNTQQHVTESYRYHYRNQ